MVGKPLAFPWTGPSCALCADGCVLPEPLLSPAMVKVDKVLIVATSREVLGDTAIKTGVWCAVLEARDSACCGLLWSPLHSKPHRIVDWQGGGAGSAVLRLQAAWVRAG